MMDETSFLKLANTELTQLETRLEACFSANDIDCDIEPQEGGILSLEFENGARIIINRHTAAREIWVAARSGGFHFRPENGRWIGTRDGTDLHAQLSSLIAQQTGTDFHLG
jgi:CyaY protein